MNSRWHLGISLVKSFIRMISAVIAMSEGRWEIFATGIIIAEFLGIAEELRDER